MLKKLLAGAVVAGLLALAPAVAQNATPDPSAPAAAAVDKAVKPAPKHMKHKKAVKKHKTLKSSPKHKTMKAPKKKDDKKSTM